MIKNNDVKFYLQEGLTEKKRERLNQISQCCEVNFNRLLRFSVLDSIQSDDVLALPNTIKCEIEQNLSHTVITRLQIKQAMQNFLTKAEKELKIQLEKIKTNNTITMKRGDYDIRMTDNQPNSTSVLNIEDILLLLWEHNIDVIMCPKSCLRNILTKHQLSSTTEKQLWNVVNHNNNKANGILWYITESLSSSQSIGFNTNYVQCKFYNNEVHIIDEYGGSLTLQSLLNINIDQNADIYKINF